MNEGEISLLVSFCDKVIEVASNPFAATNEYRRFLTGLLEFLFQLLLSQLCLCIRILKTIFCKNRLKGIFSETLVHYRVNKT